MSTVAFCLCNITAPKVHTFHLLITIVFDSKLSHFIFQFYGAQFRTENVEFMAGVSARQRPENAAGALDVECVALNVNFRGTQGQTLFV